MTSASRDPRYSDAYRILDPGLQSCVENVVLLFDHLRIVAGDDEDAGHAFERFFERRPVRQ
ncbi:MAG TPA: hypothetical protein VEZ15_05675, partial [Acidimicrobiia bacterium]|nr:hypothetical protein [Acidimicrobiia bacterium]